MEWVAFLRREFAVSIGRESLFRDRLLAAATAGVAATAVLGFWDFRGWDRESVAGASRLAHSALLLVAVVQFNLVVGFGLVAARSIAGERDRKSLDSLLATRFTSAEIVLGVMAAGAFRILNAIAATIPVVVLLTYLGGIDPRWTMLAGVGLTATAALILALAVWASAEARTSRRANIQAVGLLYAWFVGPCLLLNFHRLFLPSLPTWIVTPVLWALDGGPLGVVGSLAGVWPRPWGVVEATFRMAAIELALAAIVTAWTIRRLRPASRALHDVEGRIGVARNLRESARRPPRRPPCGDDPVFWADAYTGTSTSLVARTAKRLYQTALWGVVGYGVWWFAAPAFVELSERGYRASPEAFSPLALNPLVRALIECVSPEMSSNLAVGRARQEFNWTIRSFTSISTTILAVAVLVFASTSIMMEKQRDTWTGLLATPLTGDRIIRGKTLGAIWRHRSTLIGVGIIWGIGAASGAIHPLGLLAAVLYLAAALPLYTGLGLVMELREDLMKWPLDPSRWPLRVAVVLGVSVLAFLGPFTLASASLATYEDVSAVVQGLGVPGWRSPFWDRWVGARAVAAGTLLGIVATATAGFAILRALARDFDALVGRPVRRENPRRQDRATR